MKHHKLALALAMIGLASTSLSYAEIMPGANQGAYQVFSNTTQSSMNSISDNVANSSSFKNYSQADANKNGVSGGGAAPSAGAGRSGPLMAGANQGFQGSSLPGVLASGTGAGGVGTSGNGEFSIKEVGQVASVALPVIGAVMGGKDGAIVGALGGAAGAAGGCSDSMISVGCVVNVASMAASINAAVNPDSTGAQNAARALSVGAAAVNSGAVGKMTGIQSDRQIGESAAEYAARKAPQADAWSFGPAQPVAVAPTPEAVTAGYFSGVKTFSPAPVNVTGADMTGGYAYGQTIGDVRTAPVAIVKKANTIAVYPTQNVTTGAAVSNGNSAQLAALDKASQAAGVAYAQAYHGNDAAATASTLAAYNTAANTATAARNGTLPQVSASVAAPTATQRYVPNVVSFGQGSAVAGQTAVAMTKAAQSFATPSDPMSTIGSD